MISYFKFLFLATRAYVTAAEYGTAYVANVTDGGVPNCTIYVGMNREAWRITQLAIDGAPRAFRLPTSD